MADIYNLNPDRAHADAGHLYLYNIAGKHGPDGGCSGNFTLDATREPPTESEVFTHSLEYKLRLLPNTSALNSAPGDFKFLAKNQVWEWVKGGKLPGLELKCDTDNSQDQDVVKRYPSGGLPYRSIQKLSQIGASIRPMWRAHGNVELYAYFSGMLSDNLKMIKKNEVYGCADAQDPSKIFGFSGRMLSLNTEPPQNVDLNLKGTQQSSIATHYTKVFIKMVVGDQSFLKLTFGNSFDFEVRINKRILDAAYTPKMKLAFFYGGDDSSWAPSRDAGIEISDVVYKFTGTNQSPVSSKFKFERDASRPNSPFKAV